MKKTQKTDAIRNIRRNRVSFFSIVIISMLAVTAYLGLSFSAEGLLRSADAAYEAERYADITLSSTALITETDMEAIRAAAGVAEAEGTVAIPSLVSGENEAENIMLRLVPERISIPRMAEGRMPEAADECAVEKTLAGKLGYRIGDRIRVTGRNAMADMCIREKEYTVTGIFTTAEHLTEMISFEPLVLVPRGAFNPAVIPEGRYSGVLIRAETEGMYRFGAERKEAVNQTARELEQMNGRWIVTALHQTSGYIATAEDADMLNTVSVTFSLLFVVIAALVIYSTIGRLIGYESRLIGAVKAMGLKNSEVLAKYMIFGVGGTLAGTVAGILAALAFEWIVLLFFGTVFIVRKWVLAFQLLPVLAVTAGAGLLSAAAVFLACRQLLKSTAVRLMSGEGSGGYRRRKGASGSGPLYLRLILRNMRTDRKRVLVSIISIAGSCMLLMIGFSLKYAISRAAEKQYGVIQQYGMEIAADSSGRPESAGRIGEILDGEGLPFAAVYMEETVYKAGDEMGMLFLICPDEPDRTPEYFHFTDPRTGKALEVPESGVLISRMFARKYRLDTGDRFLLYDSRMNPHEAAVAGVFENYIGNNAVCSRAYAEECLGEAKPCNTLLLRQDPPDPEALRSRLEEVDGFVSLSSSRKQETLFNGLSAMLNLVILLMGILAVMIACFILLNLVNTYVNQKQNELTIMRINGYTTGETIRYAAMECYGITALGILIGLAAGYGFSAFLIRLIEQLAMGFVCEPVWISFAASAAITAAISGTIHFLAFRKIRSLKLSDIQR